MNVTQAWMFGVVSMMVVFAGFAIIGYFIRNKREKDETSQR